MQNTKKLKLGFIGGGVNSAVGYTHIVASQMDNRFEIVSACFSRNPEINHKTIDIWNLHHIRIYTTWTDLLEKELGKIDAVVILTPTPTHCEIAIKSISMGYPVICEKALASSYNEGLKILDAVHKHKGFLAVTHNYTGYPMLRELREKIKAGHLGKVLQIHAEMPQEGFIRLNTNNQKPTPQEWRLQDGIIPSVSLDLGTHIHHMIYFLSGEFPNKITTDQNSFGWFKDIIDDVTATAHYPSGMKSVIWYGKAALGYRNGLKIRVFGTEGSAEWYQMDPEFLVFHDIYGTRKLLDRASNVEVANQPQYNRFKSGHPAGFIEAFANLYLDISEEIFLYKKKMASNTDWTYGVDPSIKVLKILQGI